MTKLKSFLRKDLLEFKVFRILAFPVGTFFLLIGILYICNGGLDYDFKFTVSITFLGLLILFYAVKKQIQLRKVQNDE